MKSDPFLNLAHISGEIWGTQARVHGQPTPPSAQAGGQPGLVLSADIYFDILGRLVDVYKREVTDDGDDTAETSDGEDT